MASGQGLEPLQLGLKGGGGPLVGQQLGLLPSQHVESNRGVHLTGQIQQVMNQIYRTPTILRGGSELCLQGQPVIQTCGQGSKQDNHNQKGRAGPQERARPKLRSRRVVEWRERRHDAEQDSELP